MMVSALVTHVASNKYIILYQENYAHYKKNWYYRQKNFDGYKSIDKNFIINKV